MGPAPIVVGVDVSLGSARAVEWAVGEAARRGCGLRLVHVVDSADSEVCARVPGLAVDTAGDALLGICMTMAARIDASVRADASVQTGDPADELIAASNGAQLVVVGANGAAGYGRSALGSVASRVAVHAQCPVVVVSARALVAQPRMVVVGVEAGAAISSGILRYAQATAEASGARLERVDFTNHEHALTALLAAARSADLVVLGTHHTDERFGARLGSVAAGVLPFVECPVVLVTEST